MDFIPAFVQSPWYMFWGWLLTVSLVILSETKGVKAKPRLRLSCYLGVVLMWVPVVVRMVLMLMD